MKLIAGILFLMIPGAVSGEELLVAPSNWRLTHDSPPNDSLKKCFQIKSISEPKPGLDACALLSARLGTNIAAGYYCAKSGRISFLTSMSGDNSMGPDFYIGRLDMDGRIVGQYCVQPTNDSPTTYECAAGWDMTRVSSCED
jgi:hypothetical protein